MSNALAVPTVTAAITALLQSAMSAAGMASTPTVAPGNLDDEQHLPRVIVHLYHVERNPDLDNQDLPTRTTTRALTRRPRTALRLHYLLGFRCADF
jgi:hypothetical protein